MGSSRTFDADIMSWPLRSRRTGGWPPRSTSWRWPSDPGGGRSSSVSRLTVTQQPRCNRLERNTVMSKVLLEMSMSLDGYVTGPTSLRRSPWAAAASGCTRPSAGTVAWTMTAEGRRRVRNCSRYVDVPGSSGRLLRRRDEQAQVSHLDLGRRIRRRPEPERGEPARRGWGATARLGRFAGRLARVALQAGRRGEREHADHGGDVRDRRRWRDGPQHVRARGRRGL